MAKRFAEDNLDLIEQREHVRTRPEDYDLNGERIVYDWNHYLEELETPNLFEPIVFNNNNNDVIFERDEGEIASEEEYPEENWGVQPVAYITEGPRFAPIEIVRGVRDGLINGVNDVMDVMEAFIPLPEALRDMIPRPQEPLVEVPMNEVMEQAQQFSEMGVIQAQHARGGQLFQPAKARVIQYRVLDLVDMVPEHNYNIALRYQPETSSGTRVVDDVIAHHFYQCQDRTNLSFRNRGRFHTLCLLPYSRAVTGDAQQEFYLTEEEGAEPYVTCTAFFNVMSMRGATFGQLELAMNSRAHDFYTNTVQTGVLFARYHVKTGALGGMDTQIIEHLYDRFYVHVRSTRGRLVSEDGGYKAAKFYSIRLGPYPVPLLTQGFLDTPENISDAIWAIQDDYLRELNARLATGVAGGYEDNSDIDTMDTLNSNDANLRRVEKIIIRFLPPSVSENKPEVDVTQWRPHLFATLPPPIQRQGEDATANHPRLQPVDEIRVGCLISDQQKLERQIERLSNIWSPPADSLNDCFFYCLAQAALTQSLTVATARELYGIRHANHLNRVDLESIAEQRGEVYNIYQIVKTSYHEKSLIDQQDPALARISAQISHVDTIKASGNTLQHQVYHFLFHHEHCYWIKDVVLVTQKVKCSTCSMWINRKSFLSHIENCFRCEVCREPIHPKKTNTPHRCAGAPTYVRPAIRKQQRLALSQEVVSQDWVPMPMKKLGVKITSPAKIYVADFETFVNDQQEHEVYAAALLCLEDKENPKDIEHFYGREALHDFLEAVLEIEGTLYFYNGSGFDNFLMLKGMIDYRTRENEKEAFHIDSRGFVKNGSRIMSFQAHSKLTVHDLYLFTHTRLSKACKEWKVPLEMSKTEFDFSKIYDYTSAERHKTELQEYLTQDVLALAHLLHIYQTTMWKAFSVDMNKSISPAQFAITVWSCNNPYLPEIYIPHRGKEENDDRAAYYGGRVMCQRKEYESSDFQPNQHYYTFNNVENYLILGDVNSLYPAAQFNNLYAHGKWKYHVYEEGELGEQDYLDFLNTHLPGACGTARSEFLRCCYLVDVHCPKHLLTAFLMERDEKGNILHTLYDKVKQWYWGSELIEASRLGYKITRVYEVKEFEKLSPLFHDYVGKCWEGRANAAKGSALNLAYKFAMNSLTGKFGQKSHHTNMCIYSTNYKPNRKTEQAFKDMIGKVVDFEPIFSNDGYNDAIILEVLNENLNPNYPIYLSAQILAYARVIMSRIMRACDAYFNPERAIYYTDTDSLLMPSACLPDLVAAGCIGKGLGQLKCDLNDEWRSEEDFAKIIKAAWAATKGPYALLYVLPDEQHKPLMEKGRSKGIPHDEHPHPHYDELRVMMSKERADLALAMRRWSRDPQCWDLPCGVVGERFYYYQSSDGTEEYYAKSINLTMIQKMMHKQGTLTAVFGGMKRCFQYYDGQVLLIKPDVVSRMPCRTDWWAPDNKKRLFLEGQDSIYDLSYPPGYEARVYEESDTEEETFDL